MRTCWRQALKVRPVRLSTSPAVNRISLNDLLAEIRELTGSDLEAEYLDPRPGDIPHSLADISNAREVLGFNPEIDLRDGLARTIELSP